MNSLFVVAKIFLSNEELCIVPSREFSSNIESSVFLFPMHSRELLVIFFSSYLGFLLFNVILNSEVRGLNASNES